MLFEFAAVQIQFSESQRLRRLARNSTSVAANFAGARPRITARSFAAGTGDSALLRFVGRLAIAARPR
jgi:hypothetical protein